MVARRDVFQAIADPTRRDIIGLLSKETHNLNAVVDRFNVSRPAIAKHLKILYECGLVSITLDGREKFFKARLEGLREVSDWSNQYKTFWLKKLDALGQFLSNDANPRGRSKKKPNKSKSKSK